jgi:hypothetical protein
MHFGEEAIMAKAPANDSIMPADKLRPLLALSKREPVQAAVGLSGDGEGLILLDKKASPKKVASMMRGLATKAKLPLNGGSIRYGRALVDPDADSSLIQFFLNKDAPGTLRPKLLEVVKRLAYAKVEISVDTAIDLAPEEDEGQQTETLETPEQSTSSGTTPETAAPTADMPALMRELAGLAGQIAKASGDAAARARLAGLATEANTQIKAQDAAAATETIARLREALQEAQTSGDGAQSPPDAGALHKDLAALIGRIASAAANDDQRKAGLARVAGEANAALKANDLAAARDAIERLRSALEQSSPGANGTTNGASGQNTAMEAWHQARSTAIGQLRQLEGAIRKFVHPQSDAAIILVKAIQANLTETPDARGIVELKNYLSSDSIITEAELPNGFGITVSLRQPLLAALASFEATPPT